MRLVNIDDYAAAAAGGLDKAAYDYFAGGAADLFTLRDNRAAFERIRLRPRVLAGIRSVELGTTLLGLPTAMPIGIAPTAFHKMAHADGECGSARAAGAAGAAFVLSSLSNTPMEEVFAATDGPRLFQLYMYKDRAITRDLVARAEAAGAQAIMLTVDAPVWGKREADVRNAFSLPPGLTAANLAGTDKADLPSGGGSGLQVYMTEIIDGALTWADVDWLCANTRLPVVIKGVCHPDDALLAADHGAAAVVVSNHGGRQLDGWPATIDVLPEVAAAAGDRLEVWLDGGIMRGAHAFRALALGADMVFVGRAVLWGLAAAGSDGVAEVLAILRAELADTLAFCGCARLADVSAAHIYRHGEGEDN